MSGSYQRLHRAVVSPSAGTAALLRELSVAGTDVNSTDQSGFSCLMVAVKNGKTERALLLIEHGASLIPDQPDDTVTPIKQATVQDPSGATLVLWEGGSAPTLSAALLPVHEWKKSQSWCAAPCLLERGLVSGAHRTVSDSQV